MAPAFMGPQTMVGFWVENKEAEGKNPKCKNVEVLQ